MTTAPATGGNARLALAAYLRLLAACLADEADLIEAGGTGCDDVLRRFREGVVAVSLQDAALETLVAQTAEPAAVAVRGRPAAARPPATGRRRG
jgi:hypothetical protein